MALHTAALIDPSLARAETREVPDSLYEAVRKRLAAARLRRGADPDAEAAILVGVVPTLAQAVLDGSHTPEQAHRILDYAIGRALA